MLEKIFGNKSAAKILLHIYHYGETYPSAIAKDYNIALNPIKQQLKRFEDAGVLISRQVGRSRLYSFNPKNPYSDPVKKLVALEYENIPPQERQELFKALRKPRRKGKPVL